MKPGDHPDFFRLPPPPGASRESRIFLDREGRFFHEGDRVAHPALAEALHRWITRHPDDGRPILTNGYDWCYFQFEDTPVVVMALRPEGAGLAVTLSDGSLEPLDPSAIALDAEGVAYARVKAGAFEARFSQHATAQLAELFVDGAEAEIAVDGARYRLGRREARAAP